jgi:hypothetical protein
MKSLNFEQFITEDNLASIQKSLDQSLKDLDLGNVNNVDDKEALEFLNAILKHDGDAKKIKKNDLKESFQFPINEDVFIDLTGKIGELLGLSTALDFIISKVILKLNKHADPDKVKTRVHAVLQWISNATSIEDYAIVRVFAWIAKLFGANGLNQKIIGKAGLIIIISILLVAGIICFPAIGTGSVAMLFAAISSMAKLHEMYGLCKDIWMMIKHPDQVDITRYGDFYDQVNDLYKEYRETHILSFSNYTE